MVHSPAVTIVTVKPVIEHTPVVVEVKASASGEVVTPVTVKGASPKVFEASPAKVMVWAASCTVNDLLTCGAANQLPFPAWFALNVHVPAVRIVTVVPSTVQTDVVTDVNATVNVEVAEAMTENGASP